MQCRTRRRRSCRASAPWDSVPWRNIYVIWRRGLAGSFVKVSGTVKGRTDVVPQQVAAVAWGRRHSRGPPSVLDSRGRSISALFRADAPSPGFCGSTLWLEDLEMKTSPAKRVRSQSWWRRLHRGFLDLMVALGTHDYIREPTEDRRWLKN